ncbi:MAG: diaminopimelate decarboxylase [Gemmatimonadota bacterium]
MAHQFAHRAGHLHCEGVPARRLAEELGTPLYVYSRSAILERYRAFRDAFAALDPLIAYAVKANGNLGVLRLLASEGAGADIVSGGELRRALAAGVPAERIVFSGVGKTEAELAEALDAGIYGFNVESAGELRALARVAAGRGRRAPFAVRVNPDVEADTPHHYTRTGHGASKFGVAVAEAPELYRVAAADPALEVRGVSVHIGSQITEPAPFARALRRVAELVDELREGGIELTYLDVGGGFGVPYAEEPAAAPAEFAAVLTGPLAATGLRPVLEPGRIIVGPAGLLLTRVLYVKQNGGRTFVITDAGMNDLMRPSHYEGYHRVEAVDQASDREPASVDIVGPVCESGDFLALDRVLARPEEGDLLAIRTTGAYGFSMASSYNSRPRPAEALVDGDRIEVVRRRETYDDLILHEA